MKSLKGTQTEKNLMEAFSGESKARMKYDFYSSRAKKDGYEQIASIFEETARNEKEHAKLWFKHLNNGQVPDTLTNLLDCLAGEHEEWTNMYNHMAEVAREEGFEEIAKQFEGVAAIEKIHEDRYRILIENIKENTVFVKDEEVYWVCRNCGHVHKGLFAPEVCPVCQHPQSFFEVQATNF